MFGEELEDLRLDLRGLPVESSMGVCMLGVEDVRGKAGRGGEGETGVADGGVMDTDGRDGELWVCTSGGRRDGKGRVDCAGLVLPSVEVTPLPTMPRFNGDPRRRSGGLGGASSSSTSLSRKVPVNQTISLIQETDTIHTIWV